MADQSFRVALQTFKAYRHQFEGAQPPVIVAGSALEVDEALCTLEPPYQRVWFSLGVVENHALALSALWNHDRFANAGPAFTLTRTAFIGACTAFWVLQPTNSRDRVTRALRVALKDLQDSTGRFKDFLKDPTVQGQDHREGRQHANAGLRDMQASSTKARTALASLGVSEARFDETAMVEEAFVALGASLDEPLGRLLGLDAWRRASAAVHARRWVVTGLGERYTDMAGRTIQRTTFDRSDLERLVVLTARLYDHAWGRWHELNHGDSATAFGGTS